MDLPSDQIFTATEQQRCDRFGSSTVSDGYAVVQRQLAVFKPEVRCSRVFKSTQSALQGHRNPRTSRESSAGPPSAWLPTDTVCPHKIAPGLAARFTVLAVDSRGWGLEQARWRRDHVNYLKRAMALDELEVMREMGFDRFQLSVTTTAGVSHPSRARSTSAVERLTVLDVAPQLRCMPIRSGVCRGLLPLVLFDPAIRPPRTPIGADPEYFLRRTLAAWSRLRSI